MTAVQIGEPRPARLSVVGNARTREGAAGSSIRPGNSSLPLSSACSASSEWYRCLKGRPWNCGSGPSDGAGSCRSCSGRSGRTSRFAGGSWPPEKDTWSARWRNGWSRHSSPVHVSEWGARRLPQMATRPRLLCVPGSCTIWQSGPGCVSTRRVSAGVSAGVRTGGRHAPHSAVGALDRPPVLIHATTDDGRPQGPVRDTPDDLGGCLIIGGGGIMVA